MKNGGRFPSGRLSDDGQVEALLKEQQDGYIFFGEALVQLGVISEAQLIEGLKEFNRIKLGSATA